jgi:hypothetical protein
MTSMYAANLSLVMEKLPCHDAPCSGSELSNGVLVLLGDGLLRMCDVFTTVMPFTKPRNRRNHDRDPRRES